MEPTLAGMAVYEIDAMHSRFTVRAFAGGLLSALGHNPAFSIRDFTGEARLDPANTEAAYLRLRIRAASLTVATELSEKDKREIERTMNEDVLETTRYPNIEFESRSISASKAAEGRYWVNMIGDLLLHGVTRSVPLSAQLALSGETLRASGEFDLLQTDYGIKPVSFAGGALKLKDELKFAFEIVARKQE